MNAREYYVVSEDGTVLLASDCVVVHLNNEEVTELCDSTSNGERFSIASKMKPAPNLNEIMYDLQMRGN